MTSRELKDFLDSKVELYNNPKFLECDPIQVPHQFTKKEDVEISAFLTATIAWGNRKSIIRNASLIMELMEGAPFEFVKDHTEGDLNRLQHFVHRTFNGGDLICFIKGLRHIYVNHGGPEHLFSDHATATSLQPGIASFKDKFFEVEHRPRTRKHISDPSRGSAAKRINMFLRWMVRQDSHSVDFGLWESIPTRILSCPLDVHSGRVARALGLLTRKQNDAKAVLELDNSLRRLDPADPVKYDYALFGLGAFEKF